MKASWTAALGLSASLTASPANAGDVGMLNTGILYSYAGGQSPMVHGIGGEVSFMYFGDAPVHQSFGYGAFLQAQALGLSESASLHPRVSLGGQFGSWVGGEAGLTWRGATDAHAHTIGGHLGVYLSSGVTSLGLRGTLPIGKLGDLESHGFGIGLVLTLKYPATLFGDPLEGTFKMPSGRALRHLGHAVLPPVVRPGWLTTSDGLEDLDDSDRETLGAAWLHDARAEHASIAAFERLALELAWLDAPETLVRRALSAADDEARHSQICFALASRYIGETVVPGPLPALAMVPRRMPLAELAAETFVDGAIGEGMAAACAQRAARTAQLPAVHRALTQIAHDEAQHARLAWDILSWTFSTGCADVRGRLGSIFAPPPMPWADRLPIHVARRHGRLPAAVAHRVGTDTTNASQRRLAAMLHRA